MKGKNVVVGWVNVFVFFAFCAILIAYKLLSILSQEAFAGFY
jgi:hypothetical protein